MMNSIKHIVEFDTLNLVWQSGNDPNRLRYVVAELTRHDNNVQLRYLKSTQDFKTALGFGFKGYPAFNIEKDIHSSGVIEAFKRRLPPRTRGDFGKYLEMFRLPQDAEISDFALLGYSGAKLPGDEFSIIPSLEEVTQSFEFLMEVAGFRHNSKIPIESIELKSHVTFEAEPDNPVDPSAIKILLDGNKIGYVTRNLLPQFYRWLEEGRIETAVIERKNGQPDRPTLYLFVKLKAKSSMKQSM
ncbi:MAG: HIRAN domain-containing protein [Proteobacteria bacterium]|nr:HIRAN domain-containing protein [Pseudomonadota bacterium]